jgi:bifunctional DNase/RNase
MSEMVEVVIESLRVSLTNQQRIVVLRELNVDRYLPIWIGPYEAESITIALQEIEIARPQTHDLIKNIFNALDVRMLRVEITNLRDDVFYGSLVLDVNGQIINIDSRPSDALAIAVRTHVPILVARDVLDKAGIVPEETIESPSGETETGEEGNNIEAKEERLSIFEDFLENLELNDTDDDQDDDPDQLPDDFADKL